MNNKQLKTKIANLHKKIETIQVEIEKNEGMIMPQKDIDPHTQEVLKRVIPKWTKILESVNYQGYKLKGDLFNDMNFADGNGYFDEIHSKNINKIECDICNHLSSLAPYVFDLRRHGNFYRRDSIKSMLKNGFKFEKGYKIENNVSLVQFLDGVVRHIEKSHKKIFMQKTTK